MKKIIQFAFAGTLIVTFFLTGCSKKEDPAANPASTSSDPRTAFHGHWYISETSSQTGPATYYVDITDSSDASFLQIAYLYGYHTKIRATASGSSLTIPAQTIQGNNVSGGGTLINANRINMHYWVNQGGGVIDTLTAVLTK